MRRVPTPARAACVAAAGVALAGCGGDASEDASPAPTSTATVTATATATVTATATATVTASPTNGTSPPSRDCGQVAFEPDTDAGAFDIRASGVGCDVARQVARAAEGERGEPYAATAGFRCHPTGTVGQLPSVVYECTRPGEERITFEAS